MVRISHATPQSIVGVAKISGQNANSFICGYTPNLTTESSFGAYETCWRRWLRLQGVPKKVYNKISTPAALSAAPCVSIMLKEEGLQHKMYKTKLVHCSDLVPNLAVEIEMFNFCLFVCTSRFADFVKGKWFNHDSKTCSEIQKPYY